MNLFWNYLRQRRKGLLAAVLFCGIFVVSFLLYQLPVGAVLYPAGICLCAVLGFVAWDFYRAKKKVQALEQIQVLTDAMSDLLPEPEGLDDLAYQELIGRLCREQNQTRSDMNLRYEDMIDYYTVWAHQIKTPIASMRLHLQNDDTTLARRLSADLFRIEQYVEMVLVFLRLDSTSTDYVIRECQLDGIVKDAVKKFRSEFISRKLHLTYEPLNTRVVTDEKWLSFVIEQVLSNALKYTPSGGIIIYMEAPKTLCIQDTGIGIAPEDLPRIFDKGYTGYHGRSHKGASGIGLYLCRRVCCNLGHSITAQSVPDRGTCIRIDLNQKAFEKE